MVLIAVTEDTLHLSNFNLAVVILIGDSFVVFLSFQINVGIVTQNRPRPIPTIFHSLIHSMVQSLCLKKITQLVKKSPGLTKPEYSVIFTISAQWLFLCTR
jgi:hypothetical protein